MRIVVWNCRHRLAPAKEAFLVDLAADAAVLCEVTAADAERLGAHRAAGDASPRGVAVWARAGLAPVELAEPCVAAAHVAGLDATLVGAWPVVRPGSGRGGYPAQLASAIRRIAALDGPVVLGGDFNATLCARGADAANRAALADLGLVSAYHAFHGVAHGAEPAHTYRHGPDGGLWHIDFCFVPAAWAPRLRAVEVRLDAVEAGLSDHAPLVVDLDGVAAASEAADTAGIRSRPSAHGSEARDVGRIG